MNAGGHIAVAAGQESDAGLLLGAALPDLGAMGGFRLLGRSDDRSVTDGIDLHHRTDDAFHRHPWFTQRNRRLTQRLDDAGLGRGPARACSHVGIELLLDGELMAVPELRHASTRAYDAIDHRLDALDGLVRDDERTRWRRHLQLIARRHLPTDYDQPTAVAARLHRILARRPRLALAAEHIATVAAALADEQPSIADSARDFLVELRAELL
ncbi:MAG: hypothetical protein AAFN30_12175 [Actinomycetota bacterium]